MHKHAFPTEQLSAGDQSLTLGRSSRRLATNVRHGYGCASLFRGSPAAGRFKAGTADKVEEMVHSNFAEE